MYNKYRKLYIPDIEGDWAVYDFLLVVYTVELGFINYWQNRLINNDKNNTGDDKNWIITL